jgi:hypothetical protein
MYTNSHHFVAGQLTAAAAAEARRRLTLSTSVSDRLLVSRLNVLAYYPRTASESLNTRHVHVCTCVGSLTVHP